MLKINVPSLSTQQNKASNQYQHSHPWFLLRLVPFSSAFSSYSLTSPPVPYRVIRKLLLIASSVVNIHQALKVVNIYVALFWVATPCNRVGYYRRFGNLLYSCSQHKDPEINAGSSSDTLVTAGENTCPPPPRDVGQLPSRLRESQINTSKPQ